MRSTLRGFGVFAAAFATVLVAAVAPARAEVATPPTGTIDGTLTGPSGPAAGISVSAEGPTYGYATTDAQGRFELPLMAAGSYTLSFELAAGGARQYYPGQVDPAKATPVTVVAGQRTSIADTLLPTGSAKGRIVEDGAGVSGAYVIWSQVNGFGQAFVGTDSDGRYVAPKLFVGEYRVAIRLPDGRRQWAHGQVTEQTATLFTVTAGAETVVDETVLPTGEVRVRAVGATNGQPAASFCAGIDELFACTDDGTATLAKVPAGRHLVTFYPNSEGFLYGATATVDVTAGVVNDVTLRPTEAAVITTVVRDRATGAPVEGVCVNAIRTRFAQFPDAMGGCSDAEGRVRLGQLRSGTYTLFARPDTNAYGMQWVGSTGGTGNQFAARQLTVQAGQTVDAPPVLLDPAGAVTGRVTDATTGAPVANAEVALLPGHPGAGQSGPATLTDADGRYTLRGLGPYDWPLLTSGVGYAAQWSGAAPSRLVAKPVRVRAGQTTTADAKLTSGVTVRGAAQIAGAPADGWVIAFEAVTGDIVGAAWASGAGPGAYEMRVLGPTAIRLGLDSGSGTGSYWYRNASDFDHATPVLLPRRGAKTVNLIFA
jgi:5-hydroxyisourate hydrolase-like protein (transthyretin family)